MMETKQLSLKKLMRMKKKKRKLEAMVMITNLNDVDSMMSSAPQPCSGSTFNQEAQMGNIGNNMEDSPLQFNCRQEVVSTIPEKRIKRIPSQSITCEEPNKTWLDPSSPELNELRRRLRECKRKRMQIPKPILNTIGNDAEFNPSSSNGIPLFLSDIQDLMAFYLTGNTFHYPRWCQWERASKISNLTVLVVEGISSYSYSSVESQLPTLAASEIKLEVLLPSAYGGLLLEELAFVPLSPAKRRNLLEEHGSVEGILQTFKHLKYKMLRAIFPIKASADKKVGLPETDRFSRTELLLDTRRLVEEKYPVRIKGALEQQYQDFVFTKDSYTDVTSRSPLFAVDCEMCVTDAGMELTRVSVVDESLTLVYDSLVKPDLPIKDYVTRYSGITAEMMKGVTTKLADVQKVIQQLLPSDAILVGQSLNCDLNALKMMHPYVIDTSVIFNISGSRARKSKLSVLAYEFLGESIQDSRDGSGHCSVEDSSTCIKLVKLKLSNSPEFGDAVQVGRDEAAVHQAAAIAAVSGEPNAPKLAATCPQLTEGLVHCAAEAGRSIAIAGSKDVIKGYTEGFTALNDEEKVLVTDILEKNAAKAVMKAINKIPQSNAVLVHVNAPDNVKLVDDWANSLWNTLPNNAIFLVLLGGSAPATTGVALLSIKKESPK